MPALRAPFVLSIVLGFCTSLALAQSSRSSDLPERVDEAERRGDHAQAAALRAEWLAARPDAHPHGHWLCAAHLLHLQREDEAYRQLDAMLRRGYAPTAILVDAAPRLLPEAVTKGRRWQEFVARCRAREAELEADLDPARHGIADNPALVKAEHWAEEPAVTPRALHDRLSGWNEYPDPKGRDLWLRWFDTADEKLALPFYVHVPRGYSPARPTPLVVYLQGGVSRRAVVATAGQAEFSFENPVHGLARERGWLELFPSGHESVFWVEPAGRAYLARALVEVKRRFHVDDERVWLVGHSDGGSGAFAMAAFAASPFAAFAPICGSIFFTGGLANMGARPLFVLAGERDELYSLATTKTFAKRAEEVSAPWSLEVLVGHGHDWTTFAPSAMPPLFDRLQRSVRPALAERVVFESALPAELDWIAIDAVDLAAPRAPWHPKGWFGLVGEGRGLARYPAEFGVLRATRSGNTFTIETSQVGDLRILLHPRVVDFTKPVVVVRDGREVHRGIVPLSTETMLEAFWTTMDRSRIWGASLVVGKRS